MSFGEDKDLTAEHVVARLKQDQGLQAAARELSASLVGLPLAVAVQRVGAEPGLSLRFAADLAEIERQQGREQTEPGYDAPYRHQGLTADLRYGRITVWTRGAVVVRAIPDEGKFDG